MLGVPVAAGMADSEEDRGRMTTEEKARQLYRESVVIDALNVSNWDSPSVFRNLRAGGVSAINATNATWENFQQTLDNLAAWHPRFRTHAGEIAPVRTVDDILEAKTNGVTGVILGFQNASPIENDLDRLALFHDLGVRIIQLTYHERNLLGNGCYERRDDGLSNFGVDAVKEMNRLGILIDLSHVGPRTTLEAIEQSEVPVACTHANAKSYYDVPRNKADEALRLLAERGGVAGATCITTFMRTRFESTLEDYVDAIDHMVQLIGIDHVDRHRLHPGPAGIVLALYRLTAGDQVPVHLQRRLDAPVGEVALPRRPRDHRQAAQSCRRTDGAWLRARRRPEAPGRQLASTVPRGVAGVAPALRHSALPEQRCRLRSDSLHCRPELAEEPVLSQPKGPGEVGWPSSPDVRSQPRCEPLPRSIVPRHVGVLGTTVQGS